MPAETTRFAPSPTGFLHLGHVFAAFVAHELARRSGGRFLLRLEDIDTARCRPEYEAAILADLEWLGLEPAAPPLRQSTRMDAYRIALDTLSARGLTYPCFCTRREIAEELARMPSAPHGLAGPLYPGTCRALDEGERLERLAAGERAAVRLDVQACRSALGAASLHFEELGRGPAGQRGLQLIRWEGETDVVLARRDVGVSYHLAVVLDDAAQGISLVSRGEDLFEATSIQRVLQALLNLPVPRYFHHPLVRDGQGRRLAKRDEALTLRALRQAGGSPRDVHGLLAKYMKDALSNAP